MKVNVKCSYCKKEMIREFTCDIKRAVEQLIKDNTILCEDCAKDSAARQWLSNKILFDK